jgi:predicted secreted Zn-dependent protease
MAVRRRGRRPGRCPAIALKLRRKLAAGLLALAALPAVAEFEESLVLRYYDSTHRPGMTLLAAINAATPIRQDGALFHGYTAWRANWHYRWWKEADGRCRITGNQTRLAAEITLPRLTTADQAIRQRFDSYLAALKNHEMEHVRIARDYAQRIDRGILGLPTMHSCQQLERTANDLAERLLQEAKDAEREMDRRTRHGASQGASLLDD